MLVLLYRKITKTGWREVNGYDQMSYREDVAHWDTVTRSVVWSGIEETFSPNLAFSLSSREEVDGWCLFTTPPYTKVVIKHAGLGEVTEEYVNNSTDCGYIPQFVGTATYTATCKPGSVGDSVTVTKTYNSGISLADANARAMEYAVAEAEAALVCSVIDDIFEPIEDSEVCQDNSFTMSYSFRLKAWVADHTYIPDLYAQGDTLISIYDDKMFKHNADNVCIFYDRVNPADSIIQIPVAIEPKTKKKFSSLEWRTESKKGEFIELNNTFDEILLYNSRQCSGYIPLSGNLHNVKDTWTFNQFADMVDRPAEPFIKDGEPIASNIDLNKPFYTRRKFIDNYLVIRFILHNLLDTNNKQSIVSFYDLAGLMTKHIR